MINTTDLFSKKDVMIDGLVLLYEGLWYRTSTSLVQAWLLLQPAFIKLSQWNCKPHNHNIQVLTQQCHLLMGGIGMGPLHFVWAQIL